MELKNLESSQVCHKGYAALAWAEVLSIDLSDNTFFEWPDQLIWLNFLATYFIDEVKLLSHSSSCLKWVDVSILSTMILKA